MGSKMNKLATGGALMAALLLNTACATITKGTDDTVSFQSTPSSADVTISETRGKLTDTTCVTPCTLELNRKWAYQVTFVKEGYEALTQLLEPKLSGDGAAGMAGNILLGGLIGAGVDASTGAMNDLKPNPMVVTLVETGTASESPTVEIAESEIVDKAQDVADAAQATVDAAADTVEEAVESVGETIEEAAS